LLGNALAGAGADAIRGKTGERCQWLAAADVLVEAIAKFNEVTWPYGQRGGFSY